MSRGLAWFLAFVGLVVLLLSGAAWMLGSNVLAFIFHEQRSSAPFVMVNLLDFEDAAALQRYCDDYGADTLEMVEALGGRLLWSGSSDEILAGNAADHWPFLAFVEYPSRAAFIDMVTSSEYRSRVEQRAEALKRTAVLAASSRVPFEPDPRESHVVRLTRLEEGAGYVSFEAQWSDGEFELLERHAGRPAWSADLNPLQTAEPDRFDRITVIAFPDPIAAGAWALDPERETLASLEGRLLERDVVLRASTGMAGCARLNAPEPPETPPPAE